ncbi:unnamed protein product [Diatraea saccharalis]|uniref:Uncharacterized protein n=1 Tax=Diatraea saccharalis TaxID=40085 RepID=A0A9N9R743_9NEOP|nr:unnamed protein product [Diatraea saccharalis]
MPVPKGHSKKTPLLILASEIPTRNINDNADPTDLDSSKSNVVNVKLNEHREKNSKLKHEEEIDSNESNDDAVNEKELRFKSKLNSNNINNVSENKDVKTHIIVDENKNNQYVEDEKSGEEYDHNEDIEQYISELLNNLSTEKQSKEQVPVKTTKLSSVEKSGENTSVKNKNHVHFKTIKSSDVQSKPVIFGDDDIEINKRNKKNEKPVKLNSENQDLVLKSVNKPQTDTSRITQNEDVVVVPSDTRRQSTDNKGGDDDESDTNNVNVVVTSVGGDTLKQNTEANDSQRVLLKVSEPNESSLQEVIEKTKGITAVLSPNKEQSIDNSPKSYNVLKNAGIVSQSSGVVSTVGVSREKEVIVVKPNDIRVKVHNDDNYLVVSRENKVVVIKPSEIEVEVVDDDDQLTLEKEIVVVKPRDVTVNVQDDDVSAEVTGENEIVVIKPSYIEVTVRNDDEMVTRPAKVLVIKPRAIDVEVIDDDNDSINKNSKLRLPKGVSKDLVKNKNVEVTNNGEVRATIEVTGDQTAEDVLKNGSLEEILRAIGEIGHTRVPDVSANKCDQTYDRDVLKGVHKSFNLSFRFNK